MNRDIIKEEGKTILRELGVDKPSLHEKCEDLKNRVPKGNYTETQPVTFYTEHLEKKNFYQSASMGLNPFARTCGFTQPVESTRGVLNYKDNVNFGRETKVFEKLSSSKDLYKENPYQSYPMKQIYNLPELKAIFLQISSDYTFGIRQIRKFLNDYDANKNGFMDPEEIRRMLADIGLFLEEENLKLMLKYMDRNRDGRVAIDEFLYSFVAPMPEKRSSVISTFYHNLAKRLGSKVTFQSLLTGFNPSCVPAVERGQMSPEESKKAFMKLWPPHKHSDYITEEEFCGFCYEAGYHIESEAELLSFLAKIWPQILSLS